MTEVTIRENEAGQRLDKFLKKYLSQAPGSFLYKMLRKKNIVLNGKKATGSEKLKTGDQVRFFLAKETLDKFKGQTPEEVRWQGTSPEILYEDSQVLFLNKPSGMLSQRAKKEDLSVVEYVIWYLRNSGQITGEDLLTFHPSVCNRLDRNTSGIIGAGKTLAGLQALTEVFRKRSIKKYYLCIAKGMIREGAHIKGYLRKDEDRNKVAIHPDPCPEASFIETEYFPLLSNQEMTLLKVHLITGRAHQIRAHLSAEGHPILGDYKYGNKTWNDHYKKTRGIQDQMLHAWQLQMPQTLSGALEGIAGRKITAPLPEVFAELIKETTWEHGIPEASEVLP